MIYILCRITRIARCDSEEILRACTDEGKETLVKYAEEYHMDCLDGDDLGGYHGLVIYETEGGANEPTVSYEWSLDDYTGGLEGVWPIS